jgi:two-component system nitrate/nitrite response regulator NarL
VIRLVLVDDHPFVLQGLVQVLEQQEGLEIVATCQDGAAAVDVIRRHAPDVAVLDGRLPGLDGLGIVRALAGDPGPTRFVLLTATIGPREALTAMTLGIRGVVFKDLPVEQLVACIRTVHAGGTWLPPGVDAIDPAAAALTAREIEIVQMLVRGLRNKEVAAELGISEGTVKVHLHKVYEKLGVDGRVELVLWAQAHLP